MKETTHKMHKLNERNNYIKISIKMYVLIHKAKQEGLTGYWRTWRTIIKL